MQPAALHPFRYAFAGMAAMAAAMGIGRFVYTPILPGMMDGLGLSASQAGLVASANYLGYLVGAIMAAGAWAHGRERAVTLTGLGANALLLAWMGVADALDSFLAIRFLAGVASAFLMIFLTSIVSSRLFAAGRPGLQALHFGGVGVGMCVSALITGGVALAGADWRTSWLLSGAVGALVFLLVWRLAPGGPLHAEAGHRPEPALPRSPALFRIILAYGIFGAGYIVTATFLVAIVRQGDGGRLFESGVWLVTGIAGAPSVWLWGKLARRSGLAAAFAVGCLVEALGVVASVAMPAPAGPIVGGVLLGGTFIAVTALGLQAGRLLAPSAPRRALALMTAAFGIGQILGPIAAGYAADWTGSFFVPSIGAALALVASGLIGWSARSALRQS
ncbi:YbfB/YjiJ family MFS transporter [Mesorhizobium xinjiangense]|uniref:YbfB/YjiJ family MFS transporter n=1 Tax=Mesorhizobium xinjiangense TaxID=2678685 RepID=UPI001F3E6AD0|nr:YbfB/YjiJ family MFS transporter [Mesorhizobium xinjiangense]